MQKQNNFQLYIYIFLLILTCNFSCKQSNFFNLKNGDLLFQDLDSSPLCDAIEEVTSGIDDLNFSHIGVVTITNDKYYVIEAFTNGVDTINLDVFLKRSTNNENKPKVVVGRLKEIHSHLIPKAINHGIKLIGKEYDEEFKIDNNKFYCSELIYEIFLKSNNNNPFFYLNSMTYKNNGKTLNIWKEYFEDLNIPIPEGEPGINPGGISLSNKIDIIHNYMN